MAQLLLQWILSALLLLVVSVLVPGFHVAGLRAALFAALIIGLVNATLGLFLKIITFPLTILTFGIFLLVINALMLMFVSSLVRGFDVRGFGPAFFGAFLLAVLGMLTKWSTFGAR
jgi:putative membrane protein